MQDVGNTPLLLVDDVYVKLECANPGGSVKDRVAAYLLHEAAGRGELGPQDTIVETTSGNTGIALALVARSMGHKVKIFMPEHMSAERVQMIEKLGAEVCLTPQDEGFEGAVERRDEYRGRQGYYVPDQFGNPDNTRCHRLTTGAELIEQLREMGRGTVDWFVAGVGTGGTLMGVGQALHFAMPGVQLAAVEPVESSVMLGQPAGDHGIMGIGDGFIPDLLDMRQVDEVIAVSTDDAHAAAQRIREEHGHCVGRSSGANHVAAMRLRDQGFVVATVRPDCSDRYVSLGLEDPSSEQVRCPLQEDCTKRSRDMLG